MREIRYHKHAVKYLRRIPIDQKERIKAAIVRIAALGDPLADPNVKQMGGSWESCQRIRIGGYRAIYRLGEIEGLPTLEVLQVGPRGDIYMG
jgi:mRNA interferase RelE/StbE